MCPASKLGKAEHLTLCLASPQVALLAAFGAAAGHVYLRLLIRDVDGIDAADGRVAPFLASGDSQLRLLSIGCAASLRVDRQAIHLPCPMVVLGIVCLGSHYFYIPRRCLDDLSCVRLVSILCHPWRNMATPATTHWMGHRIINP